MNYILMLGVYLCIHIIALCLVSHVLMLYLFIYNMIHDHKAYTDAWGPFMYSYYDL